MGLRVAAHLAVDIESPEIYGGNGGWLRILFGVAYGFKMFQLTGL